MSCTYFMIYKGTSWVSRMPYIILEQMRRSCIKIQCRLFYEQLRDSVLIIYKSNKSTFNYTRIIFDTVPIAWNISVSNFNNTFFYSYVYVASEEWSGLSTIAVAITNQVRYLLMKISCFYFNVLYMLHSSNTIQRIRPRKHTSLIVDCLFNVFSMINT